MLPFLKPKNQSAAGVIMQTRSPDNDNDSKELEKDSLKDCAQRIIDAVHANNPEALAQALKEAMSKPEEKEDKPSPHTYDAQKE